MNSPLILLGMHRSGTSLMANWLHLNGVNMGDSLLSGDFSNQKGHFEDLDFLHLHKDILRYNHKDETGLVSYDNIRYSEYHISKLEKLIELKSKLHTQWGFKDPRTSLFLDLYREVVPNAKYIVVYRNPIEVSYSLLKRYYKRTLKTKTRYKYLPFLKNSFRKSIFNQEKFNQKAKHWNRYNILILNRLNSISKNDFICVSFNDFLQNETAFKTTLMSKWDIKFDEVSLSSIYEKSLMTSNKEIKSFTLPAESLSILHRLETIATRF